MNTSDHTPIEPQRVKRFAHFFKRYMSISSVVTAALPIPITAFNLIPTFSVHTKILSVYTPLFCFLLLGYVFYMRHQLARYMFPFEFEDKRIIKNWNAVSASLNFARFKLGKSLNLNPL